MYRKIAGWIKEHDPEGFIYFCMESPEVWDAVFGFHPANRNELDRLFAQRIRRLWNKE
jgi:spore photoproduct lyase